MDSGNLPTWNSRQLALDVLIRVERDGAYANRLLHAVFSRRDPPREVRAQVTDLVYGTLRHLTRLDYLLAQLVHKPLAEQTPTVRNLLRLALYQLGPGRFPAYAVVDESVKIAKMKDHEGVARFVNGVLRAYLRSADKLTLPAIDDQPREHLIVAHSHPAWLIDKWLKRWQPEEVHHLVRVNNEPAPLTLRVNTELTDTQSLLAELNSAGITAQPSPILPEAVRLLRGADLEQLSPLHEGKCVVQDLGAMLIAYLLNPQPGERLADLCAAPGSKTTHLAQLIHDQGTIWALDKHETKTGLIRKSAEKMGFRSILTITADARQWRSPSPLDGVLLDAPCTGTGVIRRRPDLRWRRSLQDLEELTGLQRELLNAAAGMIRPGGRLVYSTCSLLQEENEEQIGWFLRTHPDFQRDRDPETFENLFRHPSLAKTGSAEGHLLLPSEQTDGFFMTRLIRTA